MVTFSSMGLAVATEDPHIDILTMLKLAPGHIHTLVEFDGDAVIIGEGSHRYDRAS
jgi:hypothetical protein